MKLRLRRPAAHRSAVALVTVASTLGIAGCSVFSPAIVHKPYDPSDGIGTAVGDVAIRNALVVSSGIDEPGVLSVVFVNSGDDEASVGVSVDVDAGSTPPQTFTVPAGATVQIGDPSAGAGDTTVGEAIGGPAQQSAWVQIPQVPVLPGQTVPMTFTVAGTDRVVEAPVVLPCFEYAQLTPTPAPVPPTAGAAASATANPSAAAAATAAATASAEASADATAGATAVATPNPSVTCGPAVGETEAAAGEREPAAEEGEGTEGE